MGKKVDCKYVLFENIKLFSVTTFIRFLLPFEIWEFILPHPVSAVKCRVRHLNNIIRQMNCFRLLYRLFTKHTSYHFHRTSFN